MIYWSHLVLSSLVLFAFGCWTKRLLIMCIIKNGDLEGSMLNPFKIYLLELHNRLGRFFAERWTKIDLLYFNMYEKDLLYFNMYEKDRRRLVLKTV